jgi:hypothetical protein
MKWLKRLRGALGMGITWALAWAIVGGAIMEGIVDPNGRILDMWPQTLAIPGFLSGVLFSVVLGLTEGRRRFEELSLSRFARWGAVAGAVLGGVALAAGALPALPLVLRLAVLFGPTTLLGAASASGTFVLAKKAAGRQLLAAGYDSDDDDPRLTSRASATLGRGPDER